MARGDVRDGRPHRFQRQSRRGRMGMGERRAGHVHELVGRRAERLCAGRGCRDNERPPIGWNDIPIESWSPFVVEVAADTTPPEITVPSTITVAATGPRRSRRVHSDRDRQHRSAPVVTCTPPSGTTSGSATRPSPARPPTPRATCDGGRASPLHVRKEQPSSSPTWPRRSRASGLVERAATVTVAQWLLAHGQTRAACLTPDGVQPRGAGTVR